MISDEEWSMSDFKIGKPLGCGRFGSNISLNYLDFS